MTAHSTAREGAVRVVEIAARDLTQEAFAPYGEVSSPSSSARLDFADGASISEVRLEARPFALDFLARHVRTTQTYVPLGGRASILVVAPPGELADAEALPDLARLAAFRLDGSRAVTLHRGTWHRAPFVVGDQAAHFIVVDRMDTLEDLDLVDLRENLGASVSIRP